MLLSVVVYNHKLTPGQWAGAGIVFAGISVEALVKRTGEEKPRKSRLSHEKLTIPSRGPLETRCTGEGEGEDQGIITTSGPLRWAVILLLYLSLFTQERLKTTFTSTCNPSYRTMQADRLGETGRFSGRCVFADSLPSVGYLRRGEEH